MDEEEQLIQQIVESKPDEEIVIPQSAAPHEGANTVVVFKPTEL